MQERETTIKKMLKITDDEHIITRAITMEDCTDDEKNFQFVNFVFLIIPTDIKRNPMLILLCLTIAAVRDLFFLLSVNTSSMVSDQSFLFIQHS